VIEQNGRFELPPLANRDDGSPRLVGFEPEFSGITLDETVAALLSALGGRLRSETAAERVIHIHAVGEFTVELDWTYLKREAREAGRGEEGGGGSGSSS
jgi:hypothetical protein